MTVKKSIFLMVFIVMFFLLSPITLAFSFKDVFSWFSKTGYIITGKPYEYPATCSNCKDSKDLGKIKIEEHKYFKLCDYPSKSGGDWVHLDIAQTGRLWIEGWGHEHDLRMYDASNSNCDKNEQNQGIVVYKSSAPKPNTYVVPGSYRLRLGNTTNVLGYQLKIYLTSKECVSCHDSMVWNRIAAKKDWIWDEYYNTDLHKNEARYAYTCYLGNDWFYVEVSESGKLWVENSESESIVVSLYKDANDNPMWWNHCQKEHFVETCDINKPYCSFNVTKGIYRLNIKRKSGRIGELKTVIRLTDDNYQPGPSTVCSTCANPKNLGYIEIGNTIDTVACSKNHPVSGEVRSTTYSFEGDWFELTVNDPGTLLVKYPGNVRYDDKFFITLFTNKSSCKENLNFEDVVAKTSYGLVSHVKVKPGKYKLLIHGGPQSNFPLEISLRCIKEGEKGYFFNDDVCCEGLVKIKNTWPYYDSCMGVTDGSFICAKCGNGVCGPGENKCNCPKDCKEKLSPPTGFRVLSASPHSVTLLWDDVTPDVWYTITVYDINDKKIREYSGDLTPPITITQAWDGEKYSPLKPNTEYKFTIKSYTTFEESEETEPITAITQCPQGYNYDYPIYTDKSSKVCYKIEHNVDCDYKKFSGYKCNRTTYLAVPINTALGAFADNTIKITKVYPDERSKVQFLDNGEVVKEVYISSDITHYEYIPMNNIAVKFSYQSQSDQRVGIVKIESIEGKKITEFECIDSDNGKNYYVKGTVIWCEGSPSGICKKVTDSCVYCTGACPPDKEPCTVTCGAVKEYYCEDDKIKSEIHYCPNSCEDGACVPCPQSFKVEPVGASVSYFTGEDCTLKEYSILDAPGWVTWDGNGCLSNETFEMKGENKLLSIKLNDGKCLSVKTSGSYFKKVYRPEICNDQVDNDWDDKIDYDDEDCKSICQDSDGGKNYYEYGYTIHPAGNWDRCSVPLDDPRCDAAGGLVSGMCDLTSNECYGDDCYVTETFCRNNWPSQEAYECPNGCKDGACISDCSTHSIKITDVWNSNGKISVSYNKRMTDNVDVQLITTTNDKEVITSCGVTSETCTSSEGIYLLRVGESTVVYGKTVTLENVDPQGMIIVNVDGVAGLVKDKAVVNDLHISVVRYLYIDDKSERWALLKITPINEEIRCIIHTTCDYPTFKPSATHTIKVIDRVCENVYDKYKISEYSHCYDSDGGKNYYVTGIVNYCDALCRVMLDYCDGHDLLNEYYCADGKYASEKYRCQYGCENGACVKKEIENVPIYKVGTYWISERYDGEQVWKLKIVGEGIHEGEEVYEVEYTGLTGHEKGEKIKLYIKKDDLSILDPSGEEGTIDWDLKLLDFPLFIGKKWESIWTFQEFPNEPVQKIKMSFEVVGTERFDYILGKDLDVEKKAFKIKAVIENGTESGKVTFYHFVPASADFPGSNIMDVYSEFENKDPYQWFKLRDFGVEPIPTTLPYHDIAITDIETPVVNEGETFFVVGTVMNYGDYTEEVTTSMEICKEHVAPQLPGLTEESESIFDVEPIPAMCEMISGPSLTLGPKEKTSFKIGGISLNAGSYEITITASIDYDSNPYNNYRSSTLTVEKSREYEIELLAGWNMFSIPINSAKYIHKVLRGCDVISRVWHYSNADKKYKSVDKIDPGLGYWVKVRSDCVIKMSDTMVTTEQFPELLAGWNQIGAPSQTVNIHDVIGDCNLLSGPWRYNSITKKYEKSETLDPGKGYFVKVENNCHFGPEIPPPPPAPQSPPVD